MNGAILCIGVLLMAPADPRLPAKETKELREILTRALAATTSGARDKAVAAARPLEDKGGFADLVAVVRAGPVLTEKNPGPRAVGGKKEKLETFGSVTTGYSFEHDGHVYRYAVDIPSGYDPGEPHGVLIDPGHGTGAKHDAKGKAGFLGFYRRQVDSAGGKDWLVVRTEIVEQAGTGGLWKPLPEDEIVAVFDGFFRDLCSRFHVDPDRVVVTGLSQTGFWSWYLGHARADRFAGIVPMAAVTWQTRHYADNLLNLPTFVLHGVQDKTCQVAQPRGTVAALERLGAPVKYVEIPKAGHDGRVWGRLSEGLTWITAQPRVKYPKRVSKSVQTLADRWCYWVRIDGIDDAGSGEAGRAPTAGVDGEIEGQTVRLFSEGIGSVTICLSSELVDLDRPVTVVWNGKKVHEGKVVRSVETLVGIAAEKCDWKATYEASLSLRR